MLIASLLSVQVFAAKKPPKKPEIQPIPGTDVARVLSEAECVLVLNQDPSEPQSELKYFKSIKLLHTAELVKLGDDLTTSVRNSPSGRFVAKGTIPGTLSVASPLGGNPVILQAHIGAISQIEFDHDATRMLTLGGEDQEVKLFSYREGEQAAEIVPLATLAFERQKNWGNDTDGVFRGDQPQVMSVSSALRLFAIGTAEGHVEIHSLQDGALVGRAQAVFDSPVAAIEFDVQKRELHVLANDGIYARISIDSPNENRELRVDSQTAAARVVSYDRLKSDGALSVVGRTDGMIELRDGFNHELVEVNQVFPEGRYVTTVKLSKSGDIVFAGDSSGYVFILETLSTPALATLFEIPVPKVVAAEGMAGREVVAIELDPESEPKWMRVTYRSGHVHLLELLGESNADLN